MILDRVTAFAPSAARHERLRVAGAEPNDTLVYFAAGPPAGPGRLILDDLRQRLTGEGGLLVRASSTGLTLERFPTQAYRPPASVLVIRAPHERVTWEEATDIAMDALGHAIVPVDESAQRQLETLTSALHLLPADQEATILHTLRSPNVDWRIRTLEDRLIALEERIDGRAGVDGARSHEGRRRVWSRVVRLWRSRGVREVGVVLLLLAALVGIIYWPNHDGSRDRPSPTKTVPATKTEPPTTTSPAPAPSSPSPTSEPNLTPPPRPDGVAKLVAQIVEAAKSSEDPTIRRVFESHLKDMATASPEQLLASERLLLAVLKLRATRFLANKPLPDELLESTRIDRALVNTLVERVGLDKDLLTWGQDAQTGPMLAYLACQSLREPGLSVSDAKVPKMLFARMNCPIQAAEALPALTDVVGFVRSRQPGRAR
jgi:hypothetical protein